MKRRLGLKGMAMLFTCCAAVFAFTSMARAGTVVLEGSDAIDFHCAEGGSVGACTYMSQTWKALTGASSEPIAVIEGTGGVALGSGTSGKTIDNFASVAAAAAAGGGSLSGYAAVYFEGDTGDNEGPEGDTAINAAGAKALVSSYLAGGGTVMIEDYTGGAAFDSVVGTVGGADGHVHGAFTASPGDGCDDGEKVTATGTANGFTQPPAISCWEHQAYQESFFGPLGFTLSFFDAAPGLSGAATGWSGLLSSGHTLTAAEPGSLLLLLIVAFGAVLIGLKRAPLVGPSHST